MSAHDDLATAIKTGDAAAAELVVKRHPDIVNAAEWTPPPLHFAVFYNQPKIVEMLLDNGADIEMRDPDRQTTPLRYAIVYCKPDVISLLHARGANVGAITDGGTTAMEVAVEGANGAFDEYPDTPSRAEYNEIVHLLRRLGPA